MNDTEAEELVERVLAGEQRALARAITKIEDRRPGYRRIASRLHEEAGDADVVGVTGAPGTGKSTLVDSATDVYRERGDTVGVVAVDPSSPYSGGAVLGDRIRLSSSVDDPGVFYRSMSARGSLGGLSTAVWDAVQALDAYGKDVILIETVGAGQNEVDVVGYADTVAVVTQPGSGDTVQTLKAGILEIADVYVVNKADRSGVDRTVKQLEQIVEGRRQTGSGHQGFIDDDPSPESDRVEDGGWTPPVVETVATTGEGVDELVETVDDHLEWLDRSGTRRIKRVQRYSEKIRDLVRQELATEVSDKMHAEGGLEAYAQEVADGETDPYTVVESLVDD